MRYGLYAAVALAAGCMPNPDQLRPSPALRPGGPAPSPAPQPDGAPGNKYKEISGRMPGVYSQFIEKNQLVPKVHNETDSGEARLQGAVNYLRRYRDALINHPELHGPPLTAYHINTPDNFPISIPSDLQNPTQGRTLFDVVNMFLAEHDGTINKTEPGKPSTITAYGATRFVGEALHNFEQRNGKWVRTTTIVFGGQLMSNNLFHLEAQTDIYRRFTDVETAILILHEYCHGLQMEALLNLVNDHRWLNEAAQIGTDSNKMGEFLNYLRYVYNREKAVQLGVSPELKIFEAQATAVAYLFLDSLIALNQTSYFPGTRYQDPFDQEVEIIRYQYSNPRYINLYRFYISEGINRKDTQGAVKPSWLRAAGL